MKARLKPCINLEVRTKLETAIPLSTPIVVFCDPESSFNFNETDTCPYIFYLYAVSPDGLVSSYFQDWGRKLVIGDVRVQSMKEIWNSEKMNSLRLQHLEGRRKQNGVCGNCGQLSHCLPDNIDAHRPMPLEKFKKLVPVNPDVPAPGGLNHKFNLIAAE